MITRDIPAEPPPLDLLVHWGGEPWSPNPARSGLLSFLLHLLLIPLLAFLATQGGAPQQTVYRRLDLARKSTPLTAPPPRVLTQKAPNQGKPSVEVDLQSLVAQQQARQLASPPPGRPAGARREFQAPPAGQTQAPQIQLPVPEMTAQTNLPPVQGVNPIPAAPPPPISEKPKLTFETPGQVAGAPKGSPVGGRVEIPKTGIDEALRQIGRGSASSGGLVIGDWGDGTGGAGLPQITSPNTPTRQGSSLELLSDPQGVDFKPYLIKVLASVRRNWFAVIPESARLGRRGKVLIQFSISRDGKVPKLVIAMPSGTDAFDRAAVAAVSMTNPFPPLPAEFKGEQVRLQFAFLYNAPR